MSFTLSKTKTGNSGTLSDEYERLTSSVIDIQARKTDQQTNIRKKTEHANRSKTKRIYGYVTEYFLANGRDMFLLHFIKTFWLGLFYRTD